MAGGPVMKGGGDLGFVTHRIASKMHFAFRRVNKIKDGQFKSSRSELKEIAQKPYRYIHQMRLKLTNFCSHYDIS